jgi:AraC-like DNA-binding protein
MPTWGEIRTPVAARLFVEVALERGLTAEQCLRGTGLTRAQLEQPSIEVAAGQELAIARNIDLALGHPAALGVDIGSRVSFANLGVLAFAALTSATIGEALALLLRFARLTPTFLRIEPELGARELRIVMHDDELPEDVRDLILERDLAAIATFLRALCGRLPLREIQTRLPASRTTALADLLGPQVKLICGRDQTVMVAPSALLAQPLPQAEQATRQACERECLALLDARRTRTGTAARVRARLLQDPRRMPAMTELANEMSLNTRTLHRRLVAEGTNYRALVDEIRETLATELLTTTGLSVGEVAYRLGYSDPIAFTHAFTRWTGTAPSTLIAR